MTLPAEVDWTLPVAYRGVSLVMGVLNVTPDSFSDGGRFFGHDAALRQALAMIDAGADLIDIGGESTRPGATAVSDEDELSRVIPVIEALRQRCDIAISVDTSSPRVMGAAADAGASLINDVRALGRPGAVRAARASGLAIAIMHMQGEPSTMQDAPEYADPVAEIGSFLRARVDALEDRGIDRRRLLIDPGFGFGKTPAHNLELLGRLDEFHALGRPLLVGLSRKSLLQTVTGRGVGERLAGSVALATLAAERGAHIIRAHDVAATRDAVRVAAAVASRRPGGL